MVINEFIYIENFEYVLQMCHEHQEAVSSLDWEPINFFMLPDRYLASAGD